VPLKEIGERRGVSSAQVLFAWCRGKGAVVVTYVLSIPCRRIGTDEARRTSSQKGRLEDYLDAGHLVLTAEEIAAIDLAGTVAWSWTLSVRRERILPTLAMAASLVGLKMLWGAYC
jgi:aryl-alcohol dehydrogenase-like predicted oxidoreductase